MTLLGFCDTCAAQARLRNWLTHLGLQYAYGAFLEQGFDDIEFLSQSGLTDTDLDSIGVKLAGHRCVSCQELASVGGMCEWVGTAEV